MDLKTFTDYLDSTPDARKRLRDSLTPRMTEYIAQNPTPKQTAGLLCSHVPELFFGGAAGGAKSSWLLMEALQFVDVPGYAAMLMRRTYQDLAQSGALIPRSHEWLANTDAHWNEITKTWTFPSGATVSFGYLDGPRDHLRYQGGEYQMIGFDEASQLQPHQMQYLSSRLRRVLGVNVPLRLRYASNPGDLAHQWLKERFVDEETREPDTVFIPARLEDNPYLDTEEYEKSLARLDPVTRMRLRQGNWEIMEEGEMFKRRFFRRIEHYQLPRYEEMKLVRFWDIASTAESASSEGDYTVGVLMGMYRGQFYVLDVVRVRESPLGVERVIATTADLDGEEVPIRIEQEGGASGKLVADHYRRNVLPGFAVKFEKPYKNKVERARPLSAAAEGENLFIVKAEWNDEYINELSMFPMKGIHDDQVDASSGAHLQLARPKRRQIRARGSGQAA